MRETCDVGILFADIAGSTALYDRLGDRQALAIVAHGLGLMSSAVEAANGTVVKTIGDEMMAAFAAPDAAFTAALDIAGRFAALPPLPGSSGADLPARLRVRIGLHFGAALREGGDYFGDTVNVAARMAGLARADQILTTGDLVDLLGPDQRAHASEFGRIEVKGRPTPLRVAQIALAAFDPTTTVVHRGAAATAGAALTLVRGDAEWKVPSATRSVVCGRDPACDLVLSGSLVSRQHATIERRAGKVMLIDHSTNGTTLMTNGGGAPVVLRREEYGLQGSGTIVFGATGAEGAVSIGFKVG